MEIDDLKKCLNELSWDEQMDFELSETDPQSDDHMRLMILKKIKTLARTLTPTDLNNLQLDESFIVWALRLSQHVPGDNPFGRGKQFMNDHDPQIRFWASLISSDKNQ